MFYAIQHADGTGAPGQLAQPRSLPRYLRFELRGPRRALLAGTGASLRLLSHLFVAAGREPVHAHLPHLRLLPQLRRLLLTLHTSDDPRTCIQLKQHRNRGMSMFAARNRNLKFIALLAATFLLLPLVACDSKSKATPENFIAGLNAHFADHPECLFPNPPIFPYETTDPVMTKQLNALVASQLLTVAVERDIHASRYTTTDAGARVAPRFCYGHREVTAIDSFTPPTPANGFPETKVTYRYTVQNVPVWAKSTEVLAACPAMAQAISGTSTDKAALAGTIAGWQVPD